MSEFKKSSTNPEPPHVAEGKAHAAKSPVTRPNEPLGTNRHVAVDEAKPHGRQNLSSTFSAPRKDTPHDPMEAGFTHLGKV